MNNVYVRIRKMVGVQVYIFIMIYNIGQELIYIYKKKYESIVIEVE